MGNNSLPFIKIYDQQSIMALCDALSTEVSQQKDSCVKPQQDNSSIIMTTTNEKIFLSRLKNDVKNTQLTPEVLAEHCKSFMDLASSYATEASDNKALLRFGIRQTSLFTALKQHNPALTYLAETHIDDISAFVKSNQQKALPFAPYNERAPQEIKTQTPPQHDLDETCENAKNALLVLKVLTFKLDNKISNPHLSADERSSFKNEQEIYNNCSAKIMHRGNEEFPIWDIIQTATKQLSQTWAHNGRTEAIDFINRQEQFRDALLNFYPEHVSTLNSHINNLREKLGHIDTDHIPLRFSENKPSEAQFQQYAKHLSLNI